MSKVEHKDVKNQLPENKLPIGKTTEEQLKNKDVKESDRKLFHLAVRRFYVTATSKLKGYLPLDKKLLADFQCINPEAQKKIESVGAVKRLATTLNRCDNVIDVSKVEMEWRIYAVEDISEAKKKSTSAESGQLDITQFWNEVGNITMPSGDSKFVQLIRLAKLCLSFAHGNAETERSFSSSAQILTKQRNRTGVDKLNSLMVVKCHLRTTRTNAHDFLIPKKMLDNSKKAFASYSKRLEEEKRKREDEKKSLRREQDQKNQNNALNELMQSEKLKKQLLDEKNAAKTKQQEQKQLYQKLNTMMKETQNSLKQHKKTADDVKKHHEKIADIKEKIANRNIKRKSESLDSIQSCSKKPKSDRKITEMFKSEQKTNVDEVASALIPQPFNNFTALSCPADGNCLFNAISILIAGNYTLHEIN